MCWLLFGVRSTPVLPQWRVKRHRSFCLKCRCQVTPKHAYTLDPTKRSRLLSRRSVGTYLSGNELTRNFSWNTRPQSSQLAEPLWNDPGLRSGIRVRDLISKKKKKSAGGKWFVEHSSKSSHAKKKPPPPPLTSAVTELLSYMWAIRGWGIKRDT